MNPVGVFLFWLLTALVGVAAVYGYLRTRRRWLFWLIASLVVMPTTVVALRTAYTFARGTARLSQLEAGRPSLRERNNLDPRYRAFAKDTATTLLGSLVSKIEGSTFALLFELAGPMPESYRGPYPSRDEALRALLDAQVFASAAELSRPFRLAGRSISLTPAALQRALAYHTSASQSASSDATVALTLVDGTCLVVGYWNERRYYAELIDTEGFGWFARYTWDDVGRVALPARPR